MHTKVVQFIRRFFDDALIAPGLGELQDTSEKRIESWRKGYLKGQPDLMILNRTRTANGLAIEFKTPSYARDASAEQEVYLERLRHTGWETLVSNCYDEIRVENYGIQRANPTFPSDKKAQKD